MNDETRLIEQTLQGDSNAFGDLVRRYQDRLLASVVHVVGRPEEAEDVVQEAFVQAFLKLQSFKRSSSFFTWLYRIAFNVAISRRRSRNHNHAANDPLEPGVAEPPDSHGAPEEHLLLEERARQVQAALASLAEEFRAVIVLREMDGCDYEQIAEILAISVGTVRSRLHRARALMREQLKGVQQADRSE